MQAIMTDHAPSDKILIFLHNNHATIMRQSCGLPGSHHANDHAGDPPRMIRHDGELGL
ncbi:hypothetical protein [Bradyrhizobium sp.]|uniref:hypothetical protein n=1 Tax=Bradyrhizobium sp. TaxID=376 RepID=UPI0025BE6496|nr:hypothetical protein [Bradyrhizobium sp.]